MYRHFPTTDALLLGVSDLLLARLGEADMSTVEGGTAALRTQWRMFEADPSLFRVWFSVPTRSRSGGNEMLCELFRDRLASLDPAARERTLALIDLLTSPYAWDVLTRSWGLTADDALDTALDAMERLLLPAEPK